MGYTGHKCEQSGIYRGNCSCRTEIALSKGDTYPPCRTCSKGVTWTLVRPTQNYR
jgi:hypothetical protein